MSYLYEFGDYRYKTPTRMNKEEMAAAAAYLEQNGSLNAEARKQEELGYADLLADKDLISNYKKYKMAESGEDWSERSDEDTIDAYYQTMRDINNNSISAFKIAGNLRGDKFNETERFAVRQMFDKWDRVVPFYRDHGRKWDGFWDLAESYGTDPLTYAGLLTGGYATFAGKAAQQIALRGMSRAWLPFTARGAAYEAGLGTLHGSSLSYGNQTLKKDIGMISEIDKSEVAKSGAIGGLAGAVLGGIMGGVGGTYKAWKMQRDIAAGRGPQVSNLVNANQVEKLNKTEKVKGQGTKVTDPDGVVYQINKGSTGYEITMPDGSVKTGFKRLKDAQQHLEEISQSNLPKNKAGELTPDEVRQAETARKKIIAGKRITAAENLSLKRQDESIKLAERRQAFDDFVDSVDQGFVTELARRGIGKEGSRSAKQDDLDTVAVLENLGVTRDNFDLDDVIEEVAFDLAPQYRVVADDGSISYKKDRKRKTNLKRGKRKFKQEQLITLGNSLYQQAFQRALKSLENKGANPEDFIGHVEAFERIFLALEEVTSSAGRVLAYRKKLDRLRPSQLMDMMEDMLQRGGTTSRQDLLDVMSGVAEKQLKENGLFGEGVTKFYKRGRDVISETFVNNILAALNTMGVNTISSAINMHVQTFDNIVGGLLTANAAQARRGAVEFSQIYTNMWASAKVAFEAFKASKAMTNPKRVYAEVMEQGVGGLDRVAVGNRDFDLGKLLSRDGARELKREDEHLGTVGMNIFGNLLRMMGKRMMITSDEFVKQMTFRSTLTADLVEQKMRVKGVSFMQAYKEAVEEAGKLSKDHLERTAAGLKPKNKLTQQAVDRADMATFQTDFNDDIFGYVGGLAARTRNKIPFLTMIMPFIRTPANLLSESARRTPILNQFSMDLRQKMAMGGEEAAKAQAALFTGSFLWAAAGMWAMSGALTGPNPHDRGRRNVVDTAGVLPYSIRSDDGTYSQINRYDPLARPLMAMGAIHDVFAYQDNETQKELYTGLVLATAKTLLAQPSLQSLDDLFAMAAQTSGEGLGRDVDKFAGRMAKSMMPFYRFIDEINMMGDDLHLIPEIKNVWDALDGYGSSLSYLTNGTYQYSNVKRDAIFGTPVEKNQMYFRFSGIPYKPKSDDPMFNDVMYEIHDRLGMKIQPLSPKRAVLGNVDLRQFKADNETNRTVYDVYQEMVGTVKDRAGRTLLEALHARINSPQYQSRELTDFSRPAAPMPLDQGTRIEDIQGVISSFRTNAAEQLAAEIAADEDHPMHSIVQSVKDQQGREGVFKSQLTEDLTNGL